MDAPPQALSAHRRFFKYLGVGVSTFGIDLALLFLFADLFGLNYVIAAGAAFLVAITLNYFVSRRYVFRGTLRTAGEGYLIFLIIAGVGFLLVTGFMYLCVGALGINLYLSRVIVAAVVGIWNYVMNFYVNFKVAAEHAPQQNSAIAP